MEKGKTWKDYALMDNPVDGVFALKMQNAIERGWDMFGLANKKWFYVNGFLQYNDKKYSKTECETAMKGFEDNK